MLHMYSWFDFFKAVGLIVLIYYAIIGLLFLRDELKRRAVQGKNGVNTKKEGPEPAQKELFNEPSSQGAADNVALTEEQQFDLARSLGDQLREIISQAARKKTIREELMMALQILLSKKEYLHLKGTAFEPAINNLVGYECETQCSIHLSASEVHGLWIR